MKKLFFLHIPKCAGSSVRAALEAQLPRSALYQSTSVIKNYWENQPDVMELWNPDFLRAMIGHWLHQDLGLIVPGPFLFCTSVRNPSDRLRSQYRFDVLRAAETRRPTPEPGTFLSENRNVLCKFISEAFPDIASEFHEPADAACAILSGFDFVYDQRQTDVILPKLFAALGLADPGTVRENTSERCSDEITLSDDMLLATCEHDLLLWERFERARAVRPEAANPLFDESAAAQLRESMHGHSPERLRRLAMHIGWRYAEEVFHEGEVDVFQQRLAVKRAFCDAVLECFSEIRK
jgi:hypothetical protein